MQHGGQVNRHLGWVRLFCFFSSVASVVARWEHVTPSVLAVGLSRHALCRAECAVAPSAVTVPHRSEKFRKIYHAVSLEDPEHYCLSSRETCMDFCQWRQFHHPNEKWKPWKKKKAWPPINFSQIFNVRACEPAAHTHIYTQGATLFTGPLAGRTAPNHRPTLLCNSRPKAIICGACQTGPALSHNRTCIEACVIAFAHTWMLTGSRGQKKKKKKKTTTHDCFNRSCCQRPAHRTTGVPGFVCSHRAANSLLPGQSEQQCKPDVFRFGVVLQHRGSFFFARGAKPGSRLT